MTIEAFKYQTPPPRGYDCSRCEARGVKLWRQVTFVATNVELLCADCGRADQKLEPVEFQVDHEGNSPSKYLRDHHGCQLGNLLPAIPTEDGTTYWGFTSAPHASVCWWRALPTYHLTLAEALLLHLLYHDRGRAGGLQEAGDALWRQTFGRAAARGFLRKGAHGPGVGEWSLSVAGIHAALRAAELLAEGGFR